MRGAQATYRSLHVDAPMFAQWERSNSPIADVAVTGSGISGPYRFRGAHPDALIVRLEVTENEGE